jgi:hypothetical protein
MERKMRSSLAPIQPKLLAPQTSGFASKTLLALDFLIFWAKRLPPQAKHQP